ncbi:MAG: OmpA family protein [Gemmatimonadales bacterium]
MSFRLSLMIGLTGLMVAAACGGGQQAPVTPQPNLDSIRRADSIAQAARDRRAAEERARQEREAARERLESQRRSDSLAAAEAAMARLRESLTTRIHFDFDQSSIRAGDAAALDVKIAILRANPNLRIAVVGHADERGSDEYNLALGNRRALAARAYMVQRGIAADRISTSSRGEEQPLVMGSNEAAWAQNRRAEFTITAGGERLVAPGM